MTAVLLRLLPVSLSVGAVALAVFALGPWLDRRFSLRWRRWLWLALALRLLVPHSPALDFTRTVTLPEAPVLQAPAITPAPVQPATPVPVTPAAPAGPALSLWDLLAVLWLLGAIVALALPLVRYAAFKKTVLRGASPAGSVYDIPVLTAPGAAVPVTIGLWTPLILLPPLAYDPVQRTCVLDHEAVHARRKDNLYRLVLTAARAVHWWDPLIWLLCRQATLDLERTCDAAATARYDKAGKGVYARTVLAAAGRTLPLASQLTAGDLKARINALLGPVGRKNGALPCVLLLWAALALSGLAACALPAPEAPLPPVTTPAEPEQPEQVLPEVPHLPRADASAAPAPGDWINAPVQSCELFLDPRLPFGITWAQALLALEPGEYEQIDYAASQGVAGFCMEGRTAQYGFFPPEAGAKKEDYILGTISLYPGCREDSFRAVGIGDSMATVRGRLPGHELEAGHRVFLYDRADGHRAWLENPDGRHWALQIITPAGNARITFAASDDTVRQIDLYGPGL